MIDLHMHTTYSDGLTGVKDLLLKCEAAGLDKISIADHNTVEAYAELENPNVRKLYSGEIIPGIELSAIFMGVEIEVLGYGIDYKKIKPMIPPDMHANIRHPGLPLKDIVAMIHACGGKAVLAHPARYKEVLEPPLGKIALEELDGVECYHPDHTQEYREYLIDLCKKHDLIITGGSDYHGIGNESVGSQKVKSTL